jgi:hypothetical protein
MGPSPWRRRRKPRHARPRSVRIRPCGLCLGECLEIALGPVGQLLFLPPHGHWLTTTGPLLLLGLRLTRHRTDHNPSHRHH